jgi:ribosomal protein L40E
MAGKSNATALKKNRNLVGKYKQVRVVFVGASFLTPEAQAKAKGVDDAFGLFILDEVFRRQSILSKLKGLLKKTHHCRKCDADLMGLKAHRRKFSLDISYKELPPFKIEIEMPAIPCRKCGASNAVNEESTEFIISGAIAKAFESARGTP